MSCNNLLKAQASPDSKPDNITVATIDKVINEQSSKIFFEAPNFNFGKVYKGQTVEHIFRFANQGSSDLKINNVEPSCWCIVAILSDKIITPGETGEIKTTFNSESFRGKIRKSITVKSDDPNNLSYTLTISGEIEELITTDPKRINFGSVYKGVEINKTIAVTSDTDFKIKKMIPSSPLLDTTITEVNNNMYVINVSTKVSSEIGRFSGVINLETDNSLQPKVTIPIFGEIIGDITIYPKKIYYGNVKKGEGIVQKIFVKINKENIEISGVKVTPDYLSAIILKNSKRTKSQFLIEVYLHENADVGKLNGILEIKTNSKLQPVIKVPITGEVT